MSEHGTTHLYNKGCRCDPCKAAKSGANQKHRETVLKPEKKQGLSKIVFNFEMMLNVLAHVRKFDDIQAEKIAEELELPLRTVHKILNDLMKAGFIDSDFVVTRFRDGYYVYSVSEKTTKTLEV